MAYEDTDLCHLLGRLHRVVDIQLHILKSVDQLILTLVVAPVEKAVKQDIETSILGNR